MGSIKTPGLTWSSPEPGVHVRRADCLESNFATMGDLGAPLGKQLWAISSALKLSFPTSISDPIPYLQGAWLETRRFHPVLGATISPGDVSMSTPRIITVPALNKDDFLRDAFVIHNDGVKDATELATKMTAKDCGTMHWIPATNQVMLHVAHWKMDGVGTVMMWANFLEFLATLLEKGPGAVPESGSNLTECVDALVSSPKDEESTPSYLEAVVDGIVGTFIKGIPGIGPPVKAGTEQGAIPEKTSVRHITLDEATTKGVIEACKKNDWSVSAIAQAALIKSLATYPQHPMAKHFSTFVPVQLRRFLPAPYDSVSHAAGCIVTAWVLFVENASSRSFNDIAKATNEVFRKDFTQVTKDDQGQDVGLVDCTAPYSRRTIKLFTTNPAPELPPRTTPAMSSLGILEKYIKRDYPVGGEKLTVDDFFLSLEMLAQDQYVHVWTFRDRLNLQVSANSAFFEDASLDDELHRIKNELLAGLGVAE